MCIQNVLPGELWSVALFFWASVSGQQIRPKETLPTDAPATGAERAANFGFLAGGRF